MESFILILSLVSIAKAQIPTFGSCPDIPVVPNFDTKFVRLLITY